MTPEKTVDDLLNGFEVEPSSCVLGLDPGKTGGISLVRKDGAGIAWGMRNMTRKDLSCLFAFLRPSDPFALIEKVRSRPNQSSVATFTFGQMYERLHMGLICHGIRYDEVTPNKWQKALGCMTKGDKNVSKEKAQELFPNVRVTHQTADALLIGEYARRVFLIGSSQ